MIPKFRCFVGNKRMFEVEAIDFAEKEVQVPVYDKNTGEYLASASFNFDDIILMQSTGLKDKNGKEIFEGDVVLENGWLRRIVSFGTQEVEENFGDKRIFQGFNLYLGGGYPTAVMSDFEVLGNIHEHPELMEAADGH